MSKRAVNPVFGTLPVSMGYTYVFFILCAYFVQFHKLPTSLKFGNFTENCLLKYDFSVYFNSFNAWGCNIHT